MKKFAPFLCLLLASCGILDFGGDDERAFEFNSFIVDWLTPSAEEDPENPGYTVDGDKITDPEIAATYSFPDIHAGTAWINSRHSRITPTINVEIAEIKVPYLRWLVLQVGAGTQEGHISIGKRWTSIYEITTDIMLVRCLEDNDWVLGGQLTLIKF